MEPCPLSSSLTEMLALWILWFPQSGPMPLSCGLNLSSYLFAYCTTTCIIRLSKHWLNQRVNAAFISFSLHISKLKNLIFLLISPSGSEIESQHCWICSLTKALHGSFSLWNLYWGTDFPLGGAHVPLIFQKQSYYEKKWVI